MLLPSVITFCRAADPVAFCGIFLRLRDQKWRLCTTPYFSTYPGSDPNLALAPPWWILQIQTDLLVAAAPSPQENQGSVGCKNLGPDSKIKCLAFEVCLENWLDTFILMLSAPFYKQFISEAQIFLYWIESLGRRGRLLASPVPGRRRRRGDRPRRRRSASASDRCARSILWIPRGNGFLTSGKLIQ